MAWVEIEADAEPGLLGRVVNLVEQHGEIPSGILFHRGDDGLRIRMEVENWSDRRLKTLVARIGGFVGVRSSRLRNPATCSNTPIGI